MAMSLAQQTKNVAGAGRYGDTMLMHVNPIEVQGLASIMPLTKNPDTGNPEAFLPLMALAALGAAGGFGGTMASGGSLKDGLKMGLLGGAGGALGGALLAPAAAAAVPAAGAAAVPAAAASAAPLASSGLGATTASLGAGMSGAGAGSTAALSSAPITAGTLGGLANPAAMAPIAAPGGFGAGATPALSGLPNPATALAGAPLTPGASGIGGAQGIGGIGAPSVGGGAGPIAGNPAAPKEGGIMGMIKRNPGLALGAASAAAPLLGGGGGKGPLGSTYDYVKRTAMRDRFNPEADENGKEVRNFGPTTYMADGGPVPGAPPQAGPGGGGIASVGGPPAQGGPVQGGEDRQIVMAAIMAMRGQGDKKTAFARFIQRFGRQAFESLMAREASGGMQQASSQISSGQGGPVVGPGGGQDDMVPARINETGAEAALSNGEYVMSQPGVARAGGGSHPAGIAALEQMNQQGMRG